jgi:biopolymer transport protein ExbB
MKERILASITISAALMAMCAAGQSSDPAATSVVETAEATISTNAPASVEMVDETGGAAGNEETAMSEWARYIQQGGRTMWFIALLSVLGLGCALERLICLRRSRIVPRGLSETVAQLWDEGKFDEISALAEKDRSALARVVELLLEYRGSADILEVKTFAEDLAGRELRLEGRKAAMLATVATLAPLLGLFGTVLGLLEAFGTVAAMGEMGDASVLADSIGKALVTTVAGLAVAMPALFVHQIVRGRLSLYAVILEDEIATLVKRTVGAERKGR